MGIASAGGWVLLLVAGWLTGFCSGLLGIGGGLVVVPAMIVGLPMLGVSGPELSKVATATSLLLVIPTSIASAQAHASRGSLDWACWGALAPSIVAGGLVTSMLVQHISASLVTLLFVGFSLGYAGRLLLQRPTAAAALVELTPTRLIAVSVKGMLGGALSTALGIGVAFFAVPMLSRFVPMGRAIGTASMLALPMALAGAAGYLFAPTPDGCASCTGYVHLPAVAAVGVASVIGAPVGAQLTQKLPTARLRQIFALVLIFGAVSLLYKKLPELSADARTALALPRPSWSDQSRPAVAPEWLRPQANHRAFVQLITRKRRLGTPGEETSGNAPSLELSPGNDVPLPERRSSVTRRRSAGRLTGVPSAPASAGQRLRAEPEPAAATPDLLHTLYGR